jgi:hypothetical protein
MRRYFLRLAVVPLADAAIWGGLWAADSVLGSPVLRRMARKGAARSTEAVPVDEVVEMMSRLPRSALVSAACGAVYGGGFALVRPLLPRSTAAAGAAYQLALGTGILFAVRSLARTVGREPPPARLLWAPRALRGTARSALEGALLAQTERLVR